MSRTQMQPGSEAGFTLIEMLVVIGLIGVVAAISYPVLLPILDKYNLRGAARDAMNAVMQARSNAVRDNATWQVLVDPGANTLSLSGSSVETFNLASYGPKVRLIGTAETTCGAATSNWNDAAISQASTVSFNGRGFGSNDTIYVEDTNNSVCYAVTVTLAGAVSMRRYNGATPFAVGNWE